VRRDHPATGLATVTSQEDVWTALREFFLQQAGETEAA
jgi:hypothetical protein